MLPILFLVLIIMWIVVVPAFVLYSKKGLLLVKKEFQFSFLLDVLVIIHKSTSDNQIILRCCLCTVLIIAFYVALKIENDKLKMKA